MAVNREQRPRAAVPSVRIPDGLRELLTRSWPSMVAGATAVVLILTLAWQDGGYFPRTYAMVGAIALAVLGVLLLLRPPHYTLSTEALVGLGSLVALAVWTGVSARWSSAPDTALEDMQRNLAYAGLFGLGLIAAGSGRLARHIAWLTLAVVVVIVGAGLVSRLYPDLVASTSGASDLGAYRLSYPLGYWNAYGALAALGGVLALGLAADAPSAVLLRALAAGAAVLCGTAMYLSLSRGSWLALAVGILVLVALAAHRGSMLFTLALVGAGVAVLLLALRSYPALVDDPLEGKGQLVAGRAYGPIVVLVSLAAAAVQGFLAFSTAPQLAAALQRVMRPILLGVAAVAIVGALGFYVVAAAAVDSRSAQALGSAQDWVDRQWDDFIEAGAFSSEGSERLTSARGTRSDLYRVAIDGFEASPIRGDGSGAFEYRFAEDREVGEKVRDAHSLYLETLGELGLVGFAFVALFVSSIIAAAVRTRRQPGGMGRGQTAAVGAACAVWVVHSGVDWDWQMPGLTAPALILAATMYPYGRARKRRRHGRKLSLARSDHATVTSRVSDPESPGRLERGTVDFGRMPTDPEEQRR